MAADIDQEKEGPLDIHNATHFVDLEEFWTEKIFINSDLDIEVLKESEAFRLVK